MEIDVGTRTRSLCGLGFDVGLESIDAWIDRVRCEMRNWWDD